jgi:hypothetical protein
MKTPAVYAHRQNTLPRNNIPLSAETGDLFLGTTGLGIRNPSQISGRGLVRENNTSNTKDLCR